MLSEAKCKERFGNGLKILGPKQMLQRFWTALSKVKAGNASEYILCEIKPIIYFCTEQRKLLKTYATI